jgi:ethanolamine kinase
MKKARQTWIARGISEFSIGHSSSPPQRRTGTMTTMRSSLGDSYAKARAESKADDAAATVCCWIDGYPYLPLYYVLGNDDNDDETILRRGGLHANLRAVVARMVHEIATHKDPDGTNGGNNNAADADADVVVQRVPGGATNRLYKVGDQYLVRLFGGTEGLIDRDEETYYYTKLCRQKLAPSRYYGRFANGRIEGWLNNMRTLQTDEMVHYRIPIAQAMGKLHRANLLLDNDHDDNVDVKATTTAATKTAVTPPAPSVWIQLDRWLRQAESLQQHAAANDEKDDEFHLADIRTNISLLKEYMQRFPCAVGFCHNDVLAANILTYNNDDNNNNDRHDFIQLIDFEYGGYNYCSFDIANHWNEYAGGPPTCTDPNYETKMPTDLQQRHFLRVYRRAVMAGSDNNNGGDNNGGAEIMATDNEEEGDDEQDDDDDPVLLLLWQEVRFFLLVNHLYWGLWAVVQAGGTTTTTATSSSTYDYRRYGRNRIARYFADRDTVLSSVATPP